MDIVNIIIIEGSTSKIFHITRALLDQKASSFMLAMNDLGSDEQSVFRLTNVNITTFELFVKWLNTDPANSRRTSPEDPLHVPFEKHAWERLIPAIKVYIFGERYSIAALRNDALFHLSEYVLAHLYETRLLTSLDRWLHDKELAHKETTYVYANTCTGSALRRFFVDAYRAMSVPKFALSFSAEKYPTGFMTEVLTYKGELVTDPYPYSRWDAANRVLQWQRDRERIAAEGKEDIKVRPSPMNDVRHIWRRRLNVMQTMKRR
jgi:hypothetical protein